MILNICTKLYLSKTETADNLFGFFA